MPLHDWTRVPTHAYHDFHGRWLYSLRDSLNGGVLPKGYYARAEQTMRTMGPDVLTLQTLPPNQTETPRSGGAAMQVRYRASTGPVPTRTRQRRIGIRHTSDDRLIAIIELISPGNKASKHAVRSFVSKAARAIFEGIHVLLIDPFPPGRRDPNGLHALIWEELGGEPFALPADQPLTLAAYEASSTPRCYVERLAAGQPLPDMPLFLAEEYSVDVPLEATYLSAWEKVLPQGRALLEPK